MVTAIGMQITVVDITAVQIIEETTAMITEVLDQDVMMITVVDGTMLTVVQTTVTTARKEEMMTGDVITNLHNQTDRKVVVLTGRRHNLKPNHKGHNKAVVLVSHQVAAGDKVMAMLSQVDVSEAAVENNLQVANLLTGLLV